MFRVFKNFWKIPASNRLTRKPRSTNGTKFLVDIARKTIRRWIRAWFCGAVYRCQWWESTCAHMVDCKRLTRPRCVSHGRIAARDVTSRGNALIYDRDALIFRHQTPWNCVETSNEPPGKVLRERIQLSLTERPGDQIQFNSHSRVKPVPRDEIHFTRRIPDLHKFWREIYRRYVSFQIFRSLRKYYWY